MTKLPTIKAELASTATGKLYHAFSNAGLRINLGYKGYRDAAERFINEESDPETLAYIKNENIQIGPQLFEEIDLTPEVLYKTVVGFDNYTRAIYDVLKGIHPDSLDLKPVKRSDIPELKAFKYVGHNDLRMDMDSSNYSILY
jgi:hypothetical protein